MVEPDNVIYKAMLWGVKMGMAQAGDPVVVTSGVLEEQTGVSRIGLRPFSSNGAILLPAEH
jgi:pyruvate kinase